MMAPIDGVALKADAPVQILSNIILKEIWTG